MGSCPRCSPFLAALLAIGGTARELVSAMLIPPGSEPRRSAMQPQTVSLADALLGAVLLAIGEPARGVGRFHSAPAEVRLPPAGTASRGQILKDLSGCYGQNDWLSRHE